MSGQLSHKIKATTFADSAADVDVNVTTTWQTSTPTTATSQVKFVCGLKGAAYHIKYVHYMHSLVIIAMFNLYIPNY